MSPHSSARNEFLWSHTRQETFSLCLRRYYYAFYGAWGGWFDNAPPHVRIAYILKRLQHRRDWISDRIVYALADLLHLAPCDPAELPAAAERVAQRKLEVLRTEFSQSRAGLYRENPAHTMAFFEHYYGIPVTPEEWRDTVNRLPLALALFAGSDLGRRLCALPREDIVNINRPVAVVIDGLNVRAHPHLCIAEGGGLRIFHWETDPKVPLASLRRRLLIHALVFSVALPGRLPLRATAFSPFLGQRADFEFSGDDLAEIRAFVLDSADEMLFPLADTETNDPGDASAFEPAVPLPPAVCTDCNFRQICPFSTAPRA